MKDEECKCPHCGEIIKKNAKSCPHCGSDEETGWSDDTYMDGLDLPGDDESYNEIKEKEFNPHKIRITWITITGVVLLILFVFLTLKALGS